MWNVTLISILISIGIGFASVLAVVCCIGLIILLLKKYMFEADDNEDFKKGKNKVLPILN